MSLCLCGLVSGSVYGADSSPPGSWLNALADRLPPLRHARHDRWPLVVWQGLGYDTLTRTQIDTLLSRGIVQHLRPEAVSLPAARALAAARAPIVLMAGSSGSWPYPLAGAKPKWAYRFPSDAEVPDHWRSLPAPTRFAGWAVAADRLRAAMGEFRAAGVTVDAVWLDYEGEPSVANYAAARAANTSVPAAALRNARAFHVFRRQLWSALLSAYVAAPVREVFPQVSVTNWVQTFSAGPCPVWDWYGEPHPSSVAGLFTATNPVAYGIDTAFNRTWLQAEAPEPELVDWIYTHILLRQVSADACNRAQHAPHLHAVAWVARRVVDNPKRTTPAMSRTAYREVLRHLWLRGVAAMQVFNPERDNAPGQSLEEVEDAQQVYDEMLYFHSLLDTGSVMNTDIVEPLAPGLLWSGLVGEHTAVVRTVHHGAEPAAATISVWSGQAVSLPSNSTGQTFLLHNEASGVRIEQCVMHDTDGMRCG